MLNYILGANDAAMQTVSVGVFDAMLQQYKPSDTKVMWPGNTAKVPSDHSPGQEPKQHSIFFSDHSPGQEAKQHLISEYVMKASLVAHLRRCQS